MDLVVENCQRCMARDGRVSRLQLTSSPRFEPGIRLAEPPASDAGPSSPDERPCPELDTQDTELDPQGEAHPNTEWASREGFPSLP